MFSGIVPFTHMGPVQGYLYAEGKQLVLSNRSGACIGRHDRAWVVCQLTLLMHAYTSLCLKWRLSEVQCS